MIAGLVRRLRRAKVHKNVLVEQSVELKACEFHGTVSVGYRSYANQSYFRNAVVGRFCSIGRRCSIGASRHDVTRISTHPIAADPDYEAGPPTILGNDVWVGDQVVIVSGVTVGTGAVLGAGAIVTRDVPPYAIVGGVPARLIRFRFEEQLREQLLISEWWEYGDEIFARLAQDQNMAFLSALRDHDFPRLPAHHIRLRKA